MKITGLSHWILPVYQKYMTDWHTRINVFYGGAGSGKSYFITQKLCIKALAEKRKILVVRKVGSTLKDSVWALFNDVLSQIGNPIESINKTDLKITLFGGSEILFKGLDDSEKIKSITDITDIFIEEATELSLDDFTQLSLRLRSPLPHNQIHLAFNPVSKANWCYNYFFTGEVPDDCVVCRTTYKDNKYLPGEYISTLKELETRNPAYYRIYALGEFATLDKLVFPAYEKRLVSTEETNNCLFWCGMDFGYTNDPTAITWGFYRQADKVLYITGEYHKRGMTNGEIAKAIKQLGLSKEIITADCAEPKSIAELRQLGIKRIRPSKKGADSIMNGIDKMLRCKIIIDERCTNVIEEFENYTWEKDKKSGEYINRPIDTFNHHIDSIRYGMQSLNIDKTKNEYKSLWAMR